MLLLTPSIVVEQTEFLLVLIELSLAAQNTLQYIKTSEVNGRANMRVAVVIVKVLRGNTVSAVLSILAHIYNISTLFKF